MTKRIKRPLMMTPATRADMEKLVGEIRELKIDEQAVLADREELHRKIDKKYADRLEAISVMVSDKVALVQLWAEANPSEFAARKSIELTHGVIGFRTGTPALKLLRGWTWAKVLMAIKAHRWNNWIRTSEEVFKEAMLGYVSTHPKTFQSEFEEVGVERVQSEKFFVEPKIDEIEKTSKTEAK